MSAHTPGPWRVDLDKYEDAPSNIYGADGYEVAEVNAIAISEKHDGNKGHWATMPGMKRERCADVLRANARLIAAAPTLLDALKTAEHEGSCDCPPVELQTGGRGHFADCWTAVVRAAIAQAEGRTP